MGGIRPRHTFITTAIINAQSARTWGVEGSLDWRIIDPLILGVNAGYLNAKYLNFSLRDSTVLAPFNRDGQTMTHSPRWQVSLTAALDQPISEHYDLVANLLGSYTDSMIFAYSSLPGIVPNDTAPAYWLVNARVGVKTSDNRYGLYLVANNLLDQVYYIGSNSSSFGNLLNYGTRRIVSIEADVNF